jgi:Family of unknown function (DUF6496)
MPRKYGKAASKRVKSAMHRKKKGTSKSGGWKRRQSKKPQTGHCDRIVGNPEKRCESTEEVVK